MSRYIDADELVKYFKDKYESTDVIYFPYVLDDIDAQPTVDAVEVVRCEKCKRNTKNGNHLGAKVPYCSLNRRYVNDSGYCDRAERKDGAE